VVANGLDDFEAVRRRLNPRQEGDIDAQIVGSKPE